MHKSRLLEDAALVFPLLKRWRNARRMSSKPQAKACCPDFFLASMRLLSARV